MGLTSPNPWSDSADDLRLVSGCRFNETPTSPASNQPVITKTATYLSFKIQLKLTRLGFPLLNWNLSFSWRSKQVGSKKVEIQLNFQLAKVGWSAIWWGCHLHSPSAIWWVSYTKLYTAAQFCGSSYGKYMFMKMVHSPAKIIGIFVFWDAQASLAPTHVRPSVGPWHFRNSNLSESLVALREKLKREDLKYFSIL